jgi:hypothetical protein
LIVSPLANARASGGEGDGDDDDGAKAATARANDVDGAVAARAARAGATDVARENARRATWRDIGEGRRSVGRRPVEDAALRVVTSRRDGAEGSRRRIGRAMGRYRLQRCGVHK